MKAVVGVLLILLRVSHGAAVSCDGRQDGAQYYGALGGSVELPLESDVSQLRSVQLTKNGSVFKGFTKNRTESWIDGNIVFYSNNGSFRINDLKMSDSGEYELILFGKDGKKTGPRTVQLCVQAPVSSVKLVHQCWPPGQIKVSCLSEGDSPQYSWTLDGKTLTDSELLSGNNQTNIIVLKPNISGLLFCSVRNQVSSSSNKTNIPDCGFIFINCTVNGTTIAEWVYKENNTLCVEPTTVPPTVKHISVGKETMTNSLPHNPDSNDQLWYIRLLPIIAGVLTTLVIILVVCIAFICYFKKKKNPRAVEEDDQELTYADVRVVKNQGRKVEQSADVDVEYGQVKFSKRQRPERANPIVEDTLYAQVNKGR